VHRAKAFNQTGARETTAGGKYNEHCVDILSIELERAPLGPAEDRPSRRV
jgi:hypothetical protein